MPNFPSRFPSPERADRHGVVLVGGEMSAEWVLDAYRHGIFPWPHVDGRREVLVWSSPDPRCVIEWPRLHVSKRLARRLRRGEFQFTCNQRFGEVIRRCASEHRAKGVWITPSLIRAYDELHALGHAHSVEAWRDGELVGGVYGVSIGGMFGAESMFHVATDASKAAVVVLMRHLESRGYVLFDVQVLTDATAQLGASLISRAEYLRRLKPAIELPVTFGSLTGQA
jgi:leucyl/phenylalanyl-tRNA--protein transferase